MLAEKIKRVCRERKIPISRMERDLGFPRGSVYKWDKNDPSFQKVKRAADYLHVTVDELTKD